MALNTNTAKNQNKLYILKVRTQDAEKKPLPVHFEVFEKKTIEVEGKPEDRWVTATTTKDVTGDLNNIEVTLVDDSQKESYLLDLRYNMVSRSLFNSLFGLNSFENLEIGVYQTKPKTADGKSYASISLKQNGKRVDWKFDKNSIPPIETVKIGKKEVSNFDNMNEFYIKHLQNLSVKLRSNRAHTKSVSVPAPAHEVDTHEIPASIGDDGSDDDSGGAEKLF
jgi:hypothetical protein